MGIGDELLALGAAKATGEFCEILDRYGRRRFHVLWERAGYIARPGDRRPARPIRHGGGCRPYIDYQKTTRTRWAFNYSHRPQPGEFFDLEPDRRGEGRVIIEPYIKPSASPSKLWPFWREFVDLADDLPLAQIGPRGTKWLKGVEPIETRDFREAVAVLAACKTAVLPEGGLHHAAGALGKRVVVLVGAHTPVDITTYQIHENLAVDEPRGTGWRIKNEHAAKAWLQIRPAYVRTVTGMVLKTLD